MFMHSSITWQTFHSVITGDLPYQHIVRRTESAERCGASAGCGGFSLHLRTERSPCMAGNGVQHLRSAGGTTSSSLTDPPVPPAEHLSIQQFVCTRVFVSRFLGFHVPPPADRGTETRLRPPVIFGMRSGTSAPSDGHRSGGPRAWTYSATSIG